MTAATSAENVGFLLPLAKTRRPFCHSITFRVIYLKTLIPISLEKLARYCPLLLGLSRVSLNFLRQRSVPPHRQAICSGANRMPLISQRSCPCSLPVLLSFCSPNFQERPVVFAAFQNLLPPIQDRVKFNLSEYLFKSMVSTYLN
jgi:hypothetical protein